MQQGLRKAQAYQWICRDFSQVLDAQEIGAGRVKNSSTQVLLFTIWNLSENKQVASLFILANYTVVLQRPLILQSRSFQRISGNVLNATSGFISSINWQEDSSRVLNQIAETQHFNENNFGISTDFPGYDHNKYSRSFKS